MPVHEQIPGNGSSRRSAWIPAHLPELDGLRGLAILLVFFFHAHSRPIAPTFDSVASWGWTGVSIFFVLSGYLITSILLNQVGRPHYFRNFYARRALRIWPVYFLVAGLCFLFSRWILDLPPGVSIWKAGIIVALFLQSLTPGPISEFGALGPTWSVAIEEQYYLLWAPLVRFIRAKAVLAAGLIGLLAVSPFLRLHYGAVLKSTHTIFHLDYIAGGSLLAIALSAFHLKRAAWSVVAAVLMLAGFGSLVFCTNGTSLADSSLATGFAGAVLFSIAGTGSKFIFLRLLRSAPLRFYGKISYGFYMTHLGMLMMLTCLHDVVGHAPLAGIPGIKIVVVLVQLAASTLVAMGLWYGLEKRALKLKRYF